MIFHKRVFLFSLFVFFYFPFFVFFRKSSKTIKFCSVLGFPNVFYLSAIRFESVSVCAHFFVTFLTPFLVGRWSYINDLCFLGVIFWVSLSQKHVILHVFFDILPYFGLRDMRVPSGFGTKNLCFEIFWIFLVFFLCHFFLDHAVSYINDVAKTGSWASFIGKRGHFLAQKCPTCKNLQGFG